MSFDTGLFPEQQQQVQTNSILKDFQIGFKNAIKPISIHFLNKYIFVSIGSILILIALYGINEIIKLTTIEFPASVCLMLILFIGLSIHSWIFNESITEKYILNYIDIPCGFGLRWMNIYFTPPFITLVLSDKISVKEAFIIAAVFTIGYIFSFGFIAYFVWILQIVLGTYDHHKDNDNDNDNDNDKDKNGINNDIEKSNNKSDVKSLTLSNIDSDINTNNDEIINVNVENYDEGYALQQIATNYELSRAVTRASERNLETEISIKFISTNEHQEKEKRSDKITNWLIKWFDFLIYGMIFLIGIPIYFTTGYELLYQLGTVVLLFRTCMLLSANLRRFLHPILISFSISLLIFYIFSLIKNENFFVSIKHYKTGKTYLHLFDSKNFKRLPGAGDFLLSLMDVSIVSLSLAMYNYRTDLKRSFLSLLPPILIATFMSFFIYPPLCYHIGISSERSLGFTGRSVTMALGTPLVEALDGSVQLMAVTTIMSGILGVLCGDFILFKIFRINKNDFVSRGVSMGVTCGAVSTAHLLTVDSRAAAMSSLSFTLFGTFMVIMSAITPLVKIIQSWVNM